MEKSIKLALERGFDFGRGPLPIIPGEQYIATGNSSKEGYPVFCDRPTDFTPKVISEIIMENNLKKPFYVFGLTEEKDYLIVSKGIRLDDRIGCTIGLPIEDMRYYFEVGKAIKG